MSSIVSLTLTMAQDRLIRIDRESVELRSKNISLSFFDKEVSRLLVPQSSPFGMTCIPSFYPESSLTYDPESHALVYKRAEESIWSATHKATSKRKKNKDNSVRYIHRKRPHNYKAPEVKTYVLAITDLQVQTLRKLLTDALDNAEDKEDNILDGTRWTFFIGDQKAKTQRQENPLVKFASELVEAVLNGDVQRKDSLFNRLGENP